MYKKKPPAAGYPVFGHSRQTEWNEKWLETLRAALQEPGVTTAEPRGTLAGIEDGRLVARETSWAGGTVGTVGAVGAAAAGRKP